LKGRKQGKGRERLGKKLKLLKGRKRGKGRERLEKR
jgi:hypothetical protein